MKTYSIKIKTSSLCPMKASVFELLDQKAATFKVVIGEEKKNGMWALYVDAEEPSAFFGFIQSVSEGTTTVSADDVMSPANKITLLSRTANVINAEMTAGAESEAGKEKEELEVSEELAKLAEEKASEWMTKEEIVERMRYMLSNGCPESFIKLVVEKYRKYAKESHKPRTLYVDPFLKKGVQGKIEEGLWCAMGRMATICEGEKSVGKNVYMETLAWLLGMPLYMITCSRQMSPGAIYGEKSTDNSASEALIGMKSEAKAKVMLDSSNIQIRAEDKMKAVDAAAEFELQKARAASVSIVIDQSELYDWMVDGGVLILNEMNMMESNFFSSFANPLTDGTGFLFFPGRGEVKMNPDCVLFGTQNAGYEGTADQNEATTSRFNTLLFAQPESVITLLKAATESEVKRDGFEYELNDRYFDQVQKFYSQCLAATRNGTISNSVLNIRGFVRALKTIAESGGRNKLKNWIRNCVINSCPVDERAALASILEAIITL